MSYQVVHSSKSFPCNAFIVGYEFKAMLHFITEITATANCFEYIANYVSYYNEMAPNDTEWDFRMRTF